MTHNTHPFVKPSSFQRTLASLAVAACFTNPSLVLANPSGAQVVVGSANINTVGNTLTVTNSNGAIINWQQFSIGANETTRFNQATANSAVLNRVVGGDVSRIYGALQSNGQVYLINQNGILFGPNAIVDVNKLVASTLNLSDADFLAKRFSFNGGGFGSLINQGRISTPLGGSVYLIGSAVRNEGLINTPQGQVVLAAGNSVSLIDSAGPELSVTISATNNRAINLGTISANGGQINMFGALLEQQGILRADSASADASGKITLQASDSVTVSGTVSASNSAGKGGEIKVLGNQVALTGSAVIDASGATGGGTVLIGGDWQGKNGAVQNATTTTIASGAVIKADAIDNGNGGKVVVWANGSTDFKGSIFVRGGANGGDGGQVETSGKQNLQLGGNVDTLAPKGKRGMWLLDPASYCFADSISMCTSYSTSTNMDSATVGSMLNASNLVFSASDFIVFPAGMLLSTYNGRAGANLEFHAPYIFQAAAGFIGTMPYQSPAAPTGTTISSPTTSLVFAASGTSTTYASKSGKIDIRGSISTHGGDLTIKADQEINFLAPGSLNTMYYNYTKQPNGSWQANPVLNYYGNNYSSGLLYLSSPGIAIANGQTRNFYSGQDGIFQTNRFDWTTGDARGAISYFEIQTYTPGTNIHWGKSRSNADCSFGSTLCIADQFSASYFSFREANIIAGRAPTRRNNGNILDYAIDGDVVFGGFDVSTNGSMAARDWIGTIGNNITFNAGTNHDFATSQSSDGYVFGAFAKNTFSNNVGPGLFSSLAANKYWAVFVGNYAASRFNGLGTNALFMNFSSIQELDNFDGNLGRNLIGTVGYIPPTIASDPCLINPAQCAATTPIIAAKTLNIETKLAAPLTIAAALTTDQRYYDEKDRAALAAHEEKAEKATTAIESKEEQATAEAKLTRSEATKAEAEAKKAEAEAKQAAAEVKTAKTPALRAAAQKRAETKKADADVKRAEANIKKANAESLEAKIEARQLSEAKGTATPTTLTRRALIESRQARADANRADAEAQRTELREVKQALQETRQARTSEQKTIAEKRLEARKSEVIASKSEATAKRAEAEAKLADADTANAKTPQQRALAERKADARRDGATIRKSEAEGKRAEAKSKLAESEQKQAEADARTLKAPGAKEAANKRAEAQKSEASAQRAEAQSKMADAEAKKAQNEAKKAEQEAQSQKTGARKAAAERQAATKKEMAEKKQAEAKQKKEDSDKKQAEAEKKHEAARVAEVKRTEQRRIEIARAFATTNSATASRQMLGALIAQRHELKTEALKPALNILARNPVAADLPPCGTGSDVCVPTPAQVTKSTTQQGSDTFSAQQVKLFTTSLQKPTLTFVPQIERKVAVLIGINKYTDKDIPSLETAIADSQAVAKRLQESLGYEVKVIQDATRADIVKSLRSIGSEIGSNDSVTIYYAGHGYLSDETKTGYWIPSDAKASSPEQWISNKDISRLLAAIPAKQVMLVSDSCYSGTLASEQKLTSLKASTTPSEVLSKRSVTVMSSGGEEPVSDEGKEGHSIFAWSFMNALKNVGKFEFGSSLFNKVRDSVTKDFPQTPQYGASSSAGHQAGGDYLYEVRSFK